MPHLPLIAPQPPRLSTMGDELRAIEAAGLFSNGGPVVRRFEAAVTNRLFGGSGASLAVSNATLGLMIALHDAAGGRRGYALMPAFTFAATAHAALWAGLTPLLCDIDPVDWSASREAEDEAFRRHGDEIAVALPYATFGEAIDLDRYAAMADRHGVGIVVDAAASLGTRGVDGRNFGADARFATIFSMHATKTFAVAEGGLIHSADTALIDRLRRMANYGFDGGRTALGPGLNAKLPEVLGLMALAKLDELETVADHRAALAAAYRARLGDTFSFQATYAQRVAPQFIPLLLPRTLAPHRAAIMASLAATGIGTGAYFSPHLAQQPYFARTCVAHSTPHADDIAARILSLPITDAMTLADVETIAATVLDACTNTARRTLPAAVARPPVYDTVLIGGGPAGTALLTAASRAGRLADLARGLMIVESGPALGAGELGGYAITSDSTAETFLTAVRDNPHPELAALIDHPSAIAVARHIGGLGVPLRCIGPFLEAIGARLGGIVDTAGGEVRIRHRAEAAHRTAAGLWRVQLRDAAGDGAHEVLARNLVLATGGVQSRAHIGAEIVAGRSLADRLGDRLIRSDDLLRQDGLADLRQRLAATLAPRIAIVGGSTSALASAALLLKSDLPLGAGALTLLHRTALRPFYPSAAAARADSFTDFDADDICPLSGFVYRLAGFRLEARELVLRALAVGGRVPDPRLRLHRADRDDTLTGSLLDDADIVVAALGYRPRALPLFVTDGTPIPLAADAPGRPRLVDQQCRVIDAQGRPLPHAYGIGLAAGFVPAGALGGEPSFRGKANGLWLWQNDVGRLIVDQLLAPAIGQAIAA